VEIVKPTSPTIKEQAQAELINDKIGEFKEKLKAKLKERQSAKVVLANIEREIGHLEAKIDQEIKDINS